MSVTDPIADMLTVIRNASRAKKETCDVPASKLGQEILRILKSEGFIKNHKFIEDRKQGILRVYLKYGEENRSAITGLKRTSKPGLRHYVNKANIPEVLGGLGIAILSTSRGVLTDREAREAQVGGEVLCYVW